MNDTLIFLVLAGIALIFKWLTSHPSEDSEKPEPPTPNEPIKRPPPQSEEERVRRFLEALGQPPGSQLPPPVRPRTAIERRTVTPVKPPKIRRGLVQPLPPLVTVPPPVPVVAAAPPPVIVPPRPIPIPSVVRQAARLPPLAPAISPSLGKTLRTPRGLREFVVWREILGPPRGLQALDDLRSF